MTRLIIPIALIAAAVGLFSVYTNPTYQHIKALQVQSSAFQDALDKAKQLKTERDKLLSKRNTFSAEDVQKLERVLPDNIDNIRFVIDINNIAARHNLSLKNVGIGSISDSKSTRGALSVGSSGDPVGSAEITFSLSASYDDTVAFMQDLEHSLRLVDIQKISFTPSSTKGQAFYSNFTIRTYWLH